MYKQLIFFTFTLQNILMSSCLQNLIQRYQRKSSQIQQWKASSLVNKVQSQYLECLADQFLGLITLMCFTNKEKAIQTSQQKLKEISDYLNDCKSNHFHRNSNQIKRILGLFVMDIFSSQDDLGKLRAEYQLLFQDQNDEEIDTSQEQSLLLQEEIKEQEEIRFIKIRDNQSINKKQQQKKELLEKVKQEKNVNSRVEPSFRKQTKSQVQIKTESMKYNIKEEGQQTCEQSPFNMMVTIYLSKLSSPQAQLNHLCQHMKWSFYYTDEQNLQTSRFITTVHVQFSYKTIKQELSASHSAFNKQEGKKVSSFKMLRTIYLVYPEIWDLFDLIKKQKGLIQPTEQKINMQMVEMDAPIPNNFRENKSQQELNRELTQYISSINNFKSQANLLAQQNPNIITFSKFDKIQEGGKWKVKGVLTVQLNTKKQTYTEMATNINSKTAQQSLTRQLIINMYGHYREILNKMIDIKNKKSIKT